MSALAVVLIVLGGWAIWSGITGQSLVDLASSVVK